MENPPPKYFRLRPGDEVRLKYAYIIKCDEVVKDAAGNIVELRCTADLDSKTGGPNAGRKVKGTVHWVSARQAVEAEVRLYDRLPLPVRRGEGGRNPGEGAPRLLILTTGDAEKNRQFFAHKVGCPMLLQKDGEVAKAYKALGTPSGYLITPDGKIASELAMGAEALLALTGGKAENGKQKTEMDQSVTAMIEDRADRFRNRSLARSKLKRDGLKAGKPAPDFRLPRLDGKGDLSLSELRGKRVLLVFSSPSCGPCNALAPELEQFHREQMEREVGRSDNL